MAYVFLFIVAFVALLNVWLSFLAVPKIASWIVFGICLAGGLVCVFFDYRSKNLKKQQYKEINSVYLSTQRNKYTMHLKSNYLNFNNQYFCFYNRNGVNK